jgi:hypothetical protein
MFDPSSEGEGGEDEEEEEGGGGGQPRFWDPTKRTHLTYIARRACGQT